MDGLVIIYFCVCHQCFCTCRVSCFSASYRTGRGLAALEDSERGVGGPFAEHGVEHHARFAVVLMRQEGQLPLFLVCERAFGLSIHILCCVRGYLHLEPRV